MIFFLLEKAQLDTKKLLGSELFIVVLGIQSET
jgi:hypothetical protein